MAGWSSICRPTAGCCRGTTSAARRSAVSLSALIVAAVHNVRRYTASGLSRLLQASGFHPLYLTYWNAMLFPFMAVTRKLFAGNCHAESDVKPYPSPIDLICRWITDTETALLRRGIKLPFGGSVLAVAAKRRLP